MIINNEKEFLLALHNKFKIDDVCGILCNNFDMEILTSPLEEAEDHAIRNFIDDVFLGNNVEIKLNIPMKKVIKIIKSKIWVYS